jgi:hypothetical protein
MEVAHGPETKIHFSVSPSIQKGNSGSKTYATHLSLQGRDGVAAEYPTTPRKCLFGMAGVWFGYS